MKKEPEIRIVKRLKIDRTRHTVLSAVGDMQRFFGEAVLWLRQLNDRYTFNEKIILASLAVVAIGGGVILALSNAGTTELKPIAGGVQIEGLVGSPKYINPILAGTNSADRDISQLIYSGLVKIDAGREVLPDLATGWNILDGGKTYLFNLQPNALWHDGEHFSADDVVYTFNTLQNNDYTGVLKASFAGILVEKTGDLTVKFTLPAPSAFFLTDMAVGIIPEHIFANIAVKDIPARYDAGKIIGTGPYKYQSSDLNTSVTLTKFGDYYDTKPYIETVIFYFFDNAENLYTAFRNRQVSAAGFTDSVFSTTANDTICEFVLPQYKAIFFNQLSGNSLLADKTIRQALAYATNKQQIIDEVERGYAVKVDSPILSGFWGHNPDLKKYDFDIARAASLLKKAGWADADGDGILDKNKTRLSLKVAFRDEAKSRKTAELIQRNWRSIGVEAILQPLDVATLIKDVIRPRTYEVLIFGQDLGGNSDPYVYWHSSEIKDPGLALAVEVDKDIDNNLEQARTAASLSKAIPYYLKFQSAFADIVPAILLYQPKYTYLVDKKVKGVTDKINLSSATDRFTNITQWYIKSKKE